MPTLTERLFWWGAKQKMPKHLEDMRDACREAAALFGDLSEDEIRKALSDQRWQYTVGDRTMKAVFEPNGLRNLYDLQAVLDAMEKALTPPPETPLRGETTTRFHIEWIAGARPPVHPNPMTGRTAFETFEKAVAHMRNQAADAQFVSLEERVTTTVTIDRSADVRAALATEGQP